MNFKLEKRKILSAILTLSFLCSIGMPSKIAASTYCSTDYVGTGQTGGNYTVAYRNKVTTYYEGKTNTSYGKKTALGTVTNTQNKTCSMTGSYAKTRTRIHSLSGDATLPILKKAVNITIGEGVSFSEEISLSATATVAAKSSHTFYYRLNTVTDKYKHIAQPQKSTGTLGDNFVNNGSSSTSYSYVYTTTPEIIV